MWEDGSLSVLGADCSVSQVGELPLRVKSDAGKGFVRNSECEASN